jgi:hypothetical protein
MAEEKKAPATTEEVRYIGLSAQEFIKYAHEERQSGSFADKTRIDPKLHASYNQFVDALQSPGLAIQYYVFVFSKFIFIKIQF